MTTSTIHVPKSGSDRSLAALTARICLLGTTLVPVALHAEPNAVLESLAKGKFSASARYRYEIYDQDSSPAVPITDTAVASTVRLGVGYASLPWNNLTFQFDLEGVYSIGDDKYRMPTVPAQNNTTYAIIADPIGTELNQILLKWTEPSTKAQVRVGSEELALNNGRFISFSGWRQNHQTVDLAGVTVPVGGGVTAQYAYLDRVQRVIGRYATDGQLGMDSHLVTFAWARKERTNVSLYGLWLDYDRADQWANSTQTMGARVWGPWKLNSDLGIHYVADFAQQSDYGNNPGAYDVAYWQLEGGVDYKGHRLFLGWTVLEGESALAKVTTPLAHPHNGWTEKFLNNPSLGTSHGLDAMYVTLTGPVPGVKGLNYTLTAYDYHSDSNRIHYGRELDAALDYKATSIHPGLTMGWRFGRYSADRLFTDSLRTSVWVAFGF